MEEIQLTLEDNLRMKESMEWGFNYYTGELNQLGYTHQAKDNELEVYDEEGTLVGKSYLEKEGHVTSRKFEAITSVPPQVEELTNHLLLYQITMRSTERDIALLQQESLVKETAVKYGSKEEVPARIFPAVEHGNLKNISFEGIPSEEARNYLKEHSWRYSRRNRAWYPGTKEAQANNETFVKGFVQKFYPNSLPEAPQTHSDIPILEEIETEPISQPHLKNLELDNQDTAEPIPESAHEEQSSPEAIAPKTEYSFTPTIGTDGIIDYTGVEVDKIRLPNKTQILNQFLPSYLPPVEIRREGRYDIPAVKVADNQYLLKGTKKGGPIYRVSLDVYAALVDYHLKYDRAARKAIADYNNNVLKEALENEQAEFFPLRTKLPSIPEPLSFESHCQPERKRVSSRYQYSPGRVAFQQSSSHRMTSEVYYFIESEIGSGNSNIFSHHRKNLEELQQKMLDMELQHSDLESTWTKGRETAYGDSNLDESLLATYGVNIKRQNGNTLSAHEKTELQEVLNQVYSTYGNLSSITKDYGLKISHSGNTKMHASKAVGLFTPSMKALGISFGLGKDEAIYTAVHEMAHFIDHVRGQEKHAWHASDIQGTLENRIATTFRKGMNNAKGDYWNRTCECFARAMEEYGKIVHIQQKHPDWDKDKINEQISTPAYMEYTKFYNTMIPLIQEWIETTHSQMKISEWLQDSPKQKNVETEKITKSQSKGIREECLEILKKDDSQITSDDLAKLRAYEGAGGLGDKNASVNGVLNEFYTPNLVVKKMWELADAYAPNAITVLEPTAGTGRFAEGRNNNQFTMYEVDKTSARINQLLHPQATVINESFQKQFFDSEGRAINKSYSIPQFDLVIGNPPYGDYKDKWRGLGEGKEFDRYEEYFLSRGIDSLKNQDSLMIMIVPSGFLNSNDDKVKQAISSKGKLLDGWRLPEGVFPTTKVGTDILVFQRGSCQVQELCNENWFKNHPEKILGEVKTRTNRFGKQEEYVDFFAGHNLTDTLNLLVPDKSIDKLLETSSNFIEETLQENQQEVANAQSIHQGKVGREAHLRGEGVAGQTHEDNGANVPGQDSRGGRIVKDPTSPDSETAGKPVQQPTPQHNSPAPEGNDSHTSGGLGNQAGGQGWMEPHSPSLPGSLEQLPDRLTLSAQEFSRFYTGNNFSQEEYPILLATNWQGQVDSSTLSPAQREWLASSQKYIQVEEGKFINRNIFCSGNIYHKLAELESRKATLPAELYNIQKKALEESIPPIKSLDKVELSPLGSLSQSFQVTRELSRTNYDYLSHKNIQTTSQESIPLAEDFIAWATGCYNKDAENSRRYISDWTSASISREDLPSNVSWTDIVDYIEGVSVKSSRAYTEEGKTAARIEAEEKRQARKETAEQLFNRYIRTALPEHDKEQLTQEWNKRFNSYVAPDYSKLPVLVDGMSTWKDNKPFELYEQQVKGVAFLTQKGNGLLAYDVGVGKTAAGIVATVSQLQSGRAKRPLIIVPKAVYTKWINDFTQLFPNIPINDLANFSPNTLKNLNNGNHGLSIPEGSISFCTNEALQRITFEDESIEGALFEDFSNLLGKSDEAHSDNPKIRAKAISAINDEIGSASQTKDDYVFFERCGFDHITVDEAHRFKNLFRAPRSSKPDSKGMSQEFPGLGQGKPSMRAMKMFAITQMVQRNNDNRNVFMLTATPFTNSPLEVYSMLSYIGREQLKSSGVYDIRDFCTEYANVTNEWAVDAKGVIKPKSVMKSFRNPQSLQSLITQFIDKVDGEEAGIKRPNKEQHQIQLEMNEVQKMIVARETERMLDPAEKDKGGVLVAMNNMRMAMVSPALLDSSEYPEIEDFPTDIVESSPKLQYVCDTVSKVWTEKKDCGQVIYMPYGVKEMDAVKDALVKRGIPASCIALIRAGDNLSEEKIDEITSNFNDKNHKLKILIGSKKIAEGVDLNGNSIALYNTMLDWNPTETIQVEGRIWRQGNKQERVHIMYPLMEDSIESLIYQKHDEKSNRINDIFSYKGDDALDVSSINPEELKFDLIKDPEKKADFIINKKTVDMKKELTVIDARISTLNEIALKKANLQDLLKMAESSRKEMQERLDFPEKREKWFSESLAKEVVKNSKTEIIQLTAKLDTVNRRMQKMGLSDEAPLENLRSSLEGQKEILQKQIDMVASSRDEIIAEEKIMLLEKKAAAVPFQQQVDQMVRHIIENTREAPPKEKGTKEHRQQVFEKQSNAENPSIVRKHEPVQTTVSNEQQEKETEPPMEYPVGKYGQLELFAFEQTPSYNNSTKPLKETLETVLNATAVELPELPLTQENYEKLFDRGYVESPIETLKMGENQYQKFKRSDRNNLLAAAYMTLTQPSLILEKETYDEKAEQFKPVHVYGKSFYRKDSGNKRVVESIVIFKEENRIIISSHNKDVKDFVKQIKTADQIVYMDKEVGRVAVWLQEKATGHVPLQGINTRVINSSYNTDNLVSIPSLIEKPSATTVQEPSPQYLTSGDPHLTKEHIWKAKAATRTYCNPVLDGKKSGLWKNFRDFKKHGVLDILGANAEMKNGTITPHGWNQLSTALQIYRDKRFETFRYLFVSPEGKIQDQLAVCSQLPGKALANLPGENLLEQVIAHAENTGTKVVLVHNHPSGNIMPSTEDILMTEKTEAAFTRSDGKCLLAGHIILDHDSYSLYQKGNEWQAHMLNPYDIHDPLLKTRNPMEGITVSGPQSLELVAQAVNSHDKWKEEGWVPVVFTTSRSQISAVKLYPEDFLAQNNTKLLNQLQETARQTGAVLAFPIILDKDHIRQENQENLLDRMRAGCFTDFYLGEKDGTHKTAEDFNLMPGRQLFEEVGMEQVAAQTSITSTFPRHQKQEMASLGLLVAEDTRKEYESFLGQIDDYLERGKLPEYNRFILTQTPSILEFTGIPQNHVLLSTGVLNKAKKIHGLNNEEIMDSVKGLFSPLLVFSSDKSTSEAKNDSVLIITEATAKNGKPVALALELNREMTSHKQAYVVNDIRSIHDRTLVAQNGVDILKKWTGKGLLRYYDDKKISDWMELRWVQFPLSLTKSDIDTITLKDNSVKTRTQFENSMVEKIHLESSLPEKLLTPAQIREGKHQLPVKQEFMENNSFFPPMERAKDGMVHLHCTTKDLSDGISLKNKSVVLKLTSKQAAVLIDASIKQRFMDNRQAKQPTPLNIAAKSKMEKNFFTGLKSIHPQLTRKEADKQYHQVYSLIEKELKELRHEPVKQKSISRKSSGMEW